MVDHLSAAPCRLRFFNGEAGRSALATGFVVECDDGTHCLITNWHNVTGKDAVTGEFLTGMFPTAVDVTFRSGQRLKDLTEVRLPLYFDDEFTKPAWFEHPKHASDVDVVALPLPREVTEGLFLLPFNKIEFDKEFDLEVADEVFVLGYPFDSPPPFSLAIWKKGSIASEPRCDIDGLPKMYIDTATRPGLSGSPVVMQRIGLHGMSGGKFTGKESFGRIRTFAGIYSGRIGREGMAQLGIVWKPHVIADIINGARPGSCFKPEAGLGSKSGSVSADILSGNRAASQGD